VCRPLSGALAWVARTALLSGVSLGTALADEGQAFELQVEAPAPYRALLERHLDLLRYQQVPDLAASELERLAAQARENVRELLGTEGHFQPTVQVKIDNPTEPDQARTTRPTVHLVVDPGPVVRVGSVNLFLQGAAQQEPEAAAQRRALTEQWPLRQGETFKQAAWSSAKSQSLRLLTRQHFPKARIGTSLADIDAEQNLAHLYLELDSGPAVRLGEIRVQGAQRYDADMARRLVRLSGIHPGLAYDETLLQEAQRDLVTSGYYAAAFVSLGEFDDPNTAPLEVRVQEAPYQKITAGVGLSTDNGSRLSLEHVHHQVPIIGWRATSKLEWERDAKLLANAWRSPVDDKGWHWFGHGELAAQEDAARLTRSAQFRAGLAQERFVLDRSLYLQYDRARVSDIDAAQNGALETALSVNFGWTRRHYDDRIAPVQGHGLSAELGLGVTLAQDRRAFVRALGRWHSYLPLGPRASGLGRLSLRAQGGAVWSQESSPVPATQRFLAGGDQSVRGYGLREIGVRQADGGVEAGRLMYAASAEWQKPMTLQGRPSPLESAVFVDAGAVANQVASLKAKVGVGAGVRYRSPVGPLQADLAYGLDSRRWRLHLRVGFTF